MTKATYFIVEKWEFRLIKKIKIMGILFFF